MQIVSMKSSFYFVLMFLIGEAILLMGWNIILKNDCNNAQKDELKVEELKNESKSLREENLKCLLLSEKLITDGKNLRDESRILLTQKEDLESQNANSKMLAIKYRRLSGELACKINPEDVQESGGWCLVPAAADEASKWDLNGGRPAKNHMTADAGVAAGIKKFIGSGSSVTTVIDIGAGVGQYGHWFKNNNAAISWKGYDGAANVEEFTSNFVSWIDATDSLFDTIGSDVADWVISLEVGEHIPPEKTNAYLDTLDRHNRFGIICSWGVPGQAGHSHINLKSNEDVVEIFKKRGYVQDEWAMKFQDEVRKTASYFWFRNTFMVFKRQRATDS